MHITLSEQDCKLLFATHHYAHLGCFDGQDPYVVPVTYLYHDSSFYSFTQEGKKIEIMRKNPRVCLQVEQVENGFIWQSAIAWGSFEEVTDEIEEFILGTKTDTATEEWLKETRARAPGRFREEVFQ